MSDCPHCGRRDGWAPTFRLLLRADRLLHRERTAHAVTRQALTEATNDLTAHRLHLVVCRRQRDLALERMRAAEARCEEMRAQLASVLDVRVYGAGRVPGGEL